MGGKNYDIYLICYSLLSKVQDIATVNLKQMSSLNATLSDKNMRGEHTLCTITIYKLYIENGRYT